jgi:hypothetical protein
MVGFSIAELPMLVTVVLSSRVGRRSHYDVRIMGCQSHFNLQGKGMTEGRDPDGRWPTPRGGITRARIVAAAADLFARRAYE